MNTFQHNHTQVHEDVWRNTPILKHTQAQSNTSKDRLIVYPLIHGLNLQIKNWNWFTGVSWGDCSFFDSWTLPQVTWTIVHPLSHSNVHTPIARITYNLLTHLHFEVTVLGVGWSMALLCLGPSTVRNIAKSYNFWVTSTWLRICNNALRCLEPPTPLRPASCDWGPLSLEAG